MKLWEIERAQDNALEVLKSAGIDVGQLDGITAHIDNQHEVVWSISSLDVPEAAKRIRNRDEYVISAAIRLFVLARELFGLCENGAYVMPEKVAVKWTELKNDVEHPKVIETFKAERQSEIGQKRRGKEGALKKTLRLIGNYAAFLELMNDEEGLEDFNASLTPAPCILDDVAEDEAGVLCLYYRFRTSDAPKKVTLEHAKRIFRDINKPN